jgi:hypothetical protein
MYANNYMDLETTRVHNHNYFQQSFGFGIAPRCAMYTSMEGNQTMRSCATSRPATIASVSASSLPWNYRPPSTMCYISGIAAA